MHLKNLAEFDRWQAKPLHLMLLAGGFLALLCLAAVIGRHAGNSSQMDPEQLQNAQTGVVILKSDDAHFCRQLQFHNESGTFGGSKLANCDRNQADSSQLGSFRDSFRSR